MRWSLLYDSQPCASVLGAIWRGGTIIPLLFSHSSGIGAFGPLPPHTSSFQPRFLHGLVGYRVGSVSQTAGFIPFYKREILEALVLYSWFFSSLKVGEDFHKHIRNVTHCCAPFLSKFVSAFCCPYKDHVFSLSYGVTKSPAASGEITLGNLRVLCHKQSPSCTHIWHSARPKG